MRTPDRAASARAWLAAGLVVGLAAACDEASDTSTPSLDAALAVAPRAFELRGAPGPW